MYRLDGEDSTTRWGNRPLLIFNHNPKAGGGSIKTVLDSFKVECRVREVSIDEAGGDDEAGGEGEGE